MALATISLDTTNFLNLFPEFEDLDITVVEAALQKTCLVTNEYVGVKAVCGENRQIMAIFLHTAHYLTLDQRNGEGCDGGVKQSVKSKNDQITWVRDPKLGGNSLEATPYGVQLTELLDSCTPGIGYMTCSNC